MQTFWLFRHAQSDFNTRQNEYVGGRSNESPLTDLGEAQAKKLGQWMAERQLTPDAVYASPAVRTRETARLSLAAGILTPISIDDRLQEMSQGPSEGLLRDSVYTKDVLEDIQTQQLEFKLPGGESMNDVADRMHGWLGAVRSEHGSDDTITAYSHGFAIRCLTGKLLGWSHADIRSHDLENASATAFIFDADRLIDAQFGLNTQATA